MQDGVPGGTAAPSPLTPPPCTAQDGSLCPLVYDLTSTGWLARSASTLVDGVIPTVMILVVAFLLRLLIHRAINRLTRPITDGVAPAWLRALRKPLTRTAADSRTAAETRPMSTERRSQRARTIASLLRSVSSFVIYGVAFVMVLAEFGIDIAPILASAGVLGIAIGFGAQNLVRDFLSGIFMMLEDQYGVGDTVDLGEAVGDVEAVGLRTTTIRDISGTVWYVRNGEILRVGNFSQGFAFAVVDVPLAHHADTEHACVLTEQAAREVAEGEHAEDITESPELLGVQSVTPYGVTLRLIARTKPGRQWAVQRTLNARVQSTLTAAGVPAPGVTTVPAHPT